jgi:hypothetical protein
MLRNEQESINSRMIHVMLTVHFQVQAYLVIHLLQFLLSSFHGKDEKEHPGKADDYNQKLSSFPAQRDTHAMLANSVGQESRDFVSRTRSASSRR